MVINKITLELYQEADNEVGSEHAEIIVNPVLIGLFDKGEVDYYYTFKSTDGFSFNDIEEVMSTFKKVEEMVNLTK